MKKILLGCVLSFTALSYGQIQFEEVTSGFFIVPGYTHGPSVAFADVDGDSDEDLIIAGHNGASIHTRLYKNNGNGTFTLAMSFEGVNRSSIAFGDVDGDGDQDVLITGYNSSWQYISKLYKNDGNGVFTEATGTPFQGIGYGSVVFADIDGDSDLDVLISGNTDSGRITKLYKNDGTGIFTEATGTIFPGVSDNSVAFADIDGDSDLDVLISGNTGSGRITKLYKNDGTGVFTEATGTTFPGVSDNSVAFADIDGDSDLDMLLAGDTGSGRITKLYKNDGTGVFTEETGTTFPGLSLCSVTFADVNGDNAPDLLITGYDGSPEISKLYENSGNGTFTEVSGVTFLAMQSCATAFADVDGDGDKDLVITGFSGGRYETKLYRNTTCIAPIISTQPQNTTVCVNNNTTFSVSASNATQFQWQFSTGLGFANISNGGVYSDATTSTLTLTGATSVMNGYQYRCVITNGDAACSTLSNVARLTVVSLSTTGSFQTLTCNGVPDGRAEVVPSGGTMPYTYSWSPTGGTAAVASDLSVGFHTVTVTDANLCQTTRQFLITQPPLLSIIYEEITDVSCYGESNGTITTSTWGGTGTHLYNWEPGNPTGNGTNSITNLAAGTYNLTLTDQSGCTTSKAFTINEPLELNVSSSATTILCNGDQATVTVNATGGTAPYTNTGTFNETAGTYNYTVEDDNGCTATTTDITITEPTELNASAAATTILCNGNLATVTVNATGGTAPYDNTGTFTETAGTYNYTVEDDNGCTATTTVTINEPAALSASAAATTILCNGDQAIVTVNATGGTAPYDNTGTFTETAGTYNYTVEDDNGCTATTSVTINEPAALSASAAATTILCNGNQATVTVNATGGTAPHENTGTYTENAGIHTYTVEDNNGCTATTTVTINEPATLSASAAATTILCNGDQAIVTVNATGGTTPYDNTGTFTENAGIHTYTVEDNNGCTATTTVTITEPEALSASATATTILCNGDLATVTVSAAGGTAPYENTGTYNETAGTYNYTVEDDNGCTVTTTDITITEPEAINTAITLDVTTITATLSGADYQWVDCDNGNQPITGETNQSFTASTNGNYAVVITVGDCSETSSCIAVNSVGIEIVTENNNWKVSPNPTQGLFTVSTSKQMENTLLEVYAPDGRLVYSTIYSGTEISIDLHNQSRGVYILKVDNKNTFRVIKN